MLGVQATPTEPQQFAGTDRCRNPGPACSRVRPARAAMGVDVSATQEFLAMLFRDRPIRPLTD